MYHMKAMGKPSGEDYIEGQRLPWWYPLLTVWKQFDIQTSLRFKHNH